MKRLVAVMAAVWLVGAALALAQTDPKPTAGATQPADDQPRLLAAGDGRTLWVIQRLGGGEHRLLHRNADAVDGEIHKANQSKGKPIALAAADGAAFIVYADGTAQSVRYLIDEATQTPQYDIKQLPPLPADATFIDLAATPRSPLVLLRLDDESAEETASAEDANNATADKDADAAPPDDSDPGETEGAPDDAAPPAGPFVIYRYDSGRWRPAADSPPGLARSARPRLAVVGSGREPRLIVPADNGSVLTVHRFDGETWQSTVYARKVSPGFDVIAPMNLCVVVDRVGETQLACTILRQGDALAGGTIAVSPVDDEDRAVTVYNDHPAVAYIDPTGERLSIHYRDLTEAPQVDSQSVDLSITPWPRPAVNREMVMLALLVVMTVFILATWRRDPKTVIVELPESIMPAEITRRLLAGAIDLSPPLLVSMVLFGLADPGAILGTWPGPAGDLAAMLPGSLVVVLFAVHTAVTEALTGTSLGKKLLGLRVVTVKGQPPNIWQILIRNLLKIVELIGWFLLLFMLLNPAHQRMGDLAARTVVVRDADADDSHDEEE